MPHAVVYLFDGKAVEVRRLKENDRFVHNGNSFVVRFFEGLIDHCDQGDRVYYWGAWRFVRNKRGEQLMLEELADPSTPFSLPAENGQLLFPERFDVARILLIEECPPMFEMPIEGNVVLFPRRTL